MPKKMIIISVVSPSPINQILFTFLFLTEFTSFGYKANPSISIGEP